MDPHDQLDERQWLRLTDDGLIQYEHDWEEYCPCVTTFTYRAPEVFFEVIWGSLVDLWSLGCVLLQCYNGVPLAMPAELQGSTSSLTISTLQSVLTTDVVQGRWDRPVNRGKRVYVVYIYTYIAMWPIAKHRTTCIYVYTVDYTYTNSSFQGHGRRQNDVNLVTASGVFGPQECPFRHAVPGLARCGDNRNWQCEDCHRCPW